MTIVSNYDEYAEIQRKYPRSKSNDFLMPAELSKLISFGKLMYYADEKALFTLIKREGFSKLIFRLRDYSATLPPLAVSAAASIAAYLVYREGKRPTEDEEWLLSQGFGHRMKLERYTAKTLNGEWSEDGISAATARETYSMFDGLFPAEEMDLPSEDMFTGEAICTRQDDGTPSAIIYNLGNTRIMVVDEAERGKGTGSRLYGVYASREMKKSSSTVINEWIKPDNHASIAMCERLGFVKDSLVTDCYTIAVR